MLQQPIGRVLWVIADDFDDGDTQGCSVDLVVWPRVWHDWVLHTEGCGGQGAQPLREAIEALRLMGVFFNNLATRKTSPKAAL